MASRVFAICVLLGLGNSLNAQQPMGKTDFAHDVVPILKARCAKCHTNGTYKGGLSFDTREALLKGKVVVPGKSAESELIKRVVSKDKETRMPSQGEPLSEKEIGILKAWVDEGLSWEPGFTFKPTTYVAPLKPRRVTLPAATAKREHPIDRIVDAYLATNKHSPPLPLDDAAFVRRVYLDLIGLLPSASELDAFLSDAGADKRIKLIRALLAEDRSYTDHWLAFWNDLLRNEYRGTGYIDGGRKQITA